MADANWWLPVLTLLLGFAVKSVSDYYDHRRTSEREREARETEREYKLAEMRSSFQRETLLNLQEALLQLTRTIGQMHHQDLAAYRKTGEWQKQLYDERLAENNRAANARTAVLAVRVSDEAVRDGVQNFKNYGTAVIGCDSRETAAATMANMGQEFELLNQRIGEVLRKLDDNLT